MIKWTNNITAEWWILNTEIGINRNKKKCKYNNKDTDNQRNPIKKHINNNRNNNKIFH